MYVEYRQPYVLSTPVLWVLFCHGYAMWVQGVESRLDVNIQSSKLKQRVPGTRSPCFCALIGRDWTERAYVL